jgi:hypothetical protein
MAQIDIGTVLAKLNDTFDEAGKKEKSYGIAFINREGHKREVVCRKNVKSPQQKQISRDEKGREHFNLKLHGTVQVHDMVSDHPRTIKTAMIYGFRDHNSNQWLNVFH